VVRSSLGILAGTRVLGFSIGLNSATFF
jgi:hypothetical protein